MKSFLTPLLLLVALTAGAQKIHITDSENYWEFWGGEYPDLGLEGYESYIGDTVIAGIPYRVLHKHAVGNYYGEVVTFDDYYPVREDTTAGLVYVHTYDDTDVVIFNYNIHTGDVLYLSQNRYDPYIDSVAAVDTAFMDGINYKFFSMAIIDTGTRETEWTYHFIEGIGSSRTALYPQDANIWDSVTCYSHGLDMLPSHVLWWNRGTCTGENTPNVTADPDVRLFPSPAGSTLIVMNTPYSVYATIYDMMGRSMMAEQLMGKQQVIDISQLPPGMYIVQLSTDGFMKKAKFVKY